MENGVGIELNELIKIAEQLTRKRSSKLWVVTRILVSKKYRGYGHLVHMYLRWVDDIIDNPNISVAEKENFVHRQLKLMADISRLDEIKIEDMNEACLFFLNKYATENRRADIITYLKINFQAAMLDIHRLRNEGNFTSAEEEEYVTKLVSPVFFLTVCFISPKLIINENANHIGEFFYYSLSFKDFDEDMAAGFLNICKEDIIKYNVDAKNIFFDSNRFQWAKDRYPMIMKKMYDELKILRRMPFKVKLFWSPAYINVYRYLTRVKIYNYHFGFEIKKSLSQELKILISTLKMSFTVIRKVFL